MRQCKSGRYSSRPVLGIRRGFLDSSFYRFIESSNTRRFAFTYITQSSIRQQFDIIHNRRVPRQRWRHVKRCIGLDFRRHFLDITAIGLARSGGIRRSATASATGRATCGRTAPTGALAFSATASAAGDPPRFLIQQKLRAAGGLFIRLLFFLRLIRFFLTASLFLLLLFQVLGTSFRFGFLLLFRFLFGLSLFPFQSDIGS